MTPFRARAALVSLAAGALLATAATPANAAPPWSAPVDSGPPSDFVGVHGLAFTPAGRDVLGWTRSTQSLVGSGRLTPAAATQHALPAPLAAGPELDATGRGVVMTARALRTKPNAATRHRIAWARVTPRGVPGRQRSLATATFLSSGPKLAVNARGDAIAAWTEQIVLTPQGASDYRTWASYRRRGGTFGRPVVVFRTRARADANPLSVAIGRDGRAVVVEANTTRIRARLRTGRRGFGAVLGFGFQHGSTQTAAAISDRGRTLVVWGTQDGGEQADKPWVVGAARLRAGARRFFEQTLDHGGAVSRPEGRIGLAIGRDERATVAWSAIDTGPRGATFPVMSARSDRAGFFAGKRRLAASGAVGDIAVRADGATIVTWARVVESQVSDQAQAAVRPAGASRFGTVEELGPADFATPPHVAFHPLTGQPVAAWSGGVGAIDPDTLEPRASVLRLATRAAP